MRRVVLAVVSTVTALVFLLSFKTHTSSMLAAAPVAPASASPAKNGSSAGTAAGSPAASAGTSAPASSAATPSSGAASSSSSTASSSSGTASSPASAPKTVTGDVIQTNYGPVQVQITVANGKVTKAAAVEYPSQSPRDAQINSYAIPQLNSEAVAASSAQIDSVSGATYTSGGYISSLQSALDKAGV
jgi:uncharacterized protein with FMN-binding domain